MTKTVEVHFYEEAEDSLLKFAVIIAKYEDKWILCKHRARDTWEFPGGRREQGEAIAETAGRELYEETGALAFTIEETGIYSVSRFEDGQPDGEESYGMLYMARVTQLGSLPGYEIEKIELMEQLPDAWTYPEIQPKLFEKIKNSHFFKI